MNKMMKKCQTWLMAATLAFMSILTANAATVATLFKDATAVGEYETVEGAVAAYNDATAGGLYLIEVNAGEYVFSNCVITQSLTKALTIRPTKNDETFADVTLKSGSGAGFLLGVCGISHYDTMPTVIDHFTLDLSAKPKYGVKLLSGGGNRYVSHLTVSYCSFVGETTKAVYGLGAESGSQPSGITIDHCDARNLGWFWTGYIADALPEALKFTNCTVSDCKYFVGIDDGKGDVVVDNCNVTVYGGGSYAYAIRLTAGSSGVDSKAVITRSSFTVGGASGDEYCVFVGYPKEANTTKSFYVDDYTATHLFNYAGQRFADVLDRNESTTDKSAKVVVYRNGNLVHTLTSCNTEYPSNRERFFFKTVAQVVSADGVTTNGFDTLAAALAAVKSGETVEILKGGEYPVATLGGSGYTIDATTADGAVTFTRSGDGWISGCANVTVKGLKWQVTPAAYQYIQGIHAVDCTFVGLLCTLTANTFAGCTFKPAGDNQYCVNSYASDDVFTNCTFETNGKAVYCYGDGASNGGAAWKIAFADCKFQSTQRRKVAIFVKTLKDTPYDVRIDSCQLLDSNWPKDNTERAADEQYPMGANGLWGLEGADTGLVTITLDGQQVYPELNYAAKIGTKGYATLAAAIAAVKSGETIVLLAANAEVITMTKTVPFAIDANGQELSGEITPAHGYGFRIGEGTCSYMKYWNEAKIVGGSEYATLEDSIAAAQDGDVIQMLCDTTANVTFPTGKELTLDLNGMTVEGDAQDAPILTVVAGAALTLKDSFGEGTLTGGKASCGGGVANYGTFNLKSGIIENCEAVFTNGNGDTGNGGGVANYGLFRMTGGTIRNCVAGNLGGGVYSKTTTQDTGFFMTGGLITGCTAQNGFGIASDGGEAKISGTSRIVMEFKQGFNTGYGVFANGGSLKIDGGEITVKQGTASAATPSGSGAVRVTGGGSATITGGSVKANIGDAVHIDTTDSKSEISGDAKVCGSISVDVKTTGEITINGTKFNGTDEPEVAPGYVAKKDATTGTWVVERDVVKPAEKAADEVKTTVKDANGQAVTPSDALKEAMTNTVQEISDDLSSQAVGDIPNSDIIGEVKSASVRTPVVTALTAMAPQSVASEITDATRVSSFMAIELQATDMQAASAEATAVAVKSVTFEVKPVAEVTLIKDGETNRVSTVIDNEWIAGSPITFRLPVKVAGGVVRIVHTKEAVLIEEFLADVQEEDGVRFVQISSDRFSEFTEYEANADVIVAQVGDKYYDSLAEALEKAAANSTVKLIKDATLAGDVELSKALTIDADGKTITGGAITAADGYGVIATANGWTVEALSPVASVTIGGVTTSYYGLHEALEAAKAANAVCKLLENVTLTGAWAPVGTESAPFCGMFDGQGYTISGLTVSASAAYAGLIGYLNGGTVKDVKFSGVSVSSTADDVGAAVGRIVSGGIVSDVKVLSGSVTGRKRVGGVVGTVKAEGTIEDCANAASVTATGYNAGGIVGAAYYTETGKEMYVKGCANTGAVESKANNAGGIAGLSTANVWNNTNSGAVKGGAFSVGGIAGEQKTYGTVRGNVNSGSVTTSAADAYGIGGVVGWLRYHTTGENSAYAQSAIIEVANNANSGSVAGGNDAGGVIGTAYNSAVVTNNSNTAATLSAAKFAAGIVGNYQTTETPSSHEAAANKLTIGGNTTTTTIENITANCKDLVIYTNGNPVIVPSFAVAQIVVGTETNQYTTLAAALKAAQSGETIEVLDGTWGADAVGTLTTAEAGVVRFKSLTIQPAAGATVTFTAQVYLGYDDSSTANASMTVKNIAFENASLAISNYNEVWVEGCTFKNTTNKAGTLIVQDACCKNHKTAGGYPASQITIKDCVIDGSNTGASGIRLRNSGNVSITGCIIKNSQFNGILFESNSSVDNTLAKTVVVTGNTITEWNATNVKGGGRAIRAALGTLAEGSTVTIEGNTFRKETIGLDSPDFAKITEPGAATVSLDGNDWNDELRSVVSGNTAYYTVAGSAPAVAGVVTTKSEPVAQIVVGTETNQYTTLAAALKAAQSGDTIEILDGTWGADAVGTLDEPGTYTYASQVRYKTLTIQPAAGATVKFTSQVYLGYDDSSTANASMTVKNIDFENASLAISNYNVVNVEGCTFKNTTNTAGTLIVQDACCKNHKPAGGYPASQITIKDCVIDGSNTEASGIRLRNSGNVSITDCIIVNSQFNGILLESNGWVDNTSAKTVVVTGNEITEWNATNVKGGGRAIRAALGTLAEGSTVTIEGNTFRKETIGLDSPDFAKITEPGTATVSLDGNDWNDELRSVVSGNTAYYTVAGSAPAVAGVVTTKSEQVVVDKPTTIDVTVNDAEQKDVPVSDPAVTNTVAELEGNRTMLAVDTGMDAINKGRGEPVIQSVVVKLTAIKVKSTTPSVTNCTSATFDVKPVDKDGEKVVLEAGEAITFRLPIVAAFTASKVEVFHKADEASDFTSIGYYDVETYAGEKFAEVTSSAFSYFKYEIPDDAVIDGCKDSSDTENQVTIPGEWIATANISRDVATNKTALCANGQPAWVNYVLGATDVTADVAALGISVTNGEATVEFCQIDEVPSVATVKFRLMVSDTVNGTYEPFGEAQGEKTFVDDQGGEGGKPQRFYKGVITFTWVE